MVRPCEEKHCSKKMYCNEKMEVGGQRKIGRQKLRWTDAIRKDMKEKQVKIEEVQNRRTWTLKT